MIAFVEISFKEGISQKIICQAEALSSIKGECELYSLSTDNHFNRILCNNGKVTKEEKLEPLDINYHSINRVDPFIALLEKHIRTQENDVVYIRHMVPSSTYISFLKEHKNAYLIEEIPTYPYFYEQYKNSNNKILTIARLAYEGLYWPQIYKQINKIVAIPCRSTAHKYKKMQYITNGYNTLSESRQSQSSKGTKNQKLSKDKNEFVLIGVGKIQPYHGYKKIIEALKSYNGDKKITFYVIGNGETEELKNLTKKLNLTTNVIFTGIKVGQELEEYYSIADIGVGTMALELRKADIDTGIKVIDYYNHGIPVISSGTCPNVKKIDFCPYNTFKGKIDIEKIVKWSNTITSSKRDQLAKISKTQFNWAHIMKRVLKQND